MQTEPIAVIGSGIAGMLTAQRLLVAGFRVTMYTRPGEVGGFTSPNGGAFWYPDTTLDPRYPYWQRRSLRYWTHVANKYPESGVVLRQSLELCDTRPVDPPLWRVPGCRSALMDELVPGFAHGLIIDGVPVIDPQCFIRDWLLPRLLHKGLKLVEYEVPEAESLFAQHQIVVNCTGIGLKQVHGYNDVYPVRGQLVHVDQTDPPFTQVRFIGNGRTYIIPHKNRLVLGGTADRDQWDTKPDEATTQAILARCRGIAPGVMFGKVLNVTCGLRPRHPQGPQVKVHEIEGRNCLIFNACHGGAGFSLGPACAADVLTMVTAAMQELRVTAA